MHLLEIQVKFLNLYLLTFQSNAIDQVTKIDQKVGMFISHHALLNANRRLYFRIMHSIDQSTKINRKMGVSIYIYAS